MKLMKSSTFSYEQAWHRLAALCTVYLITISGTFLIALRIMLYMNIFRFSQIWVLPICLIIGYVVSVAVCSFLNL